MTGQVLITALIVSLATLVSVVDGQFSTGHSHHGRGKSVLIYLKLKTRLENIHNKQMHVKFNNIIVIF